jgi:hypothetical protein
MDLITNINHAISLVTRLREISKNIAEAEFRNLLADLSNELGDAKLEIAALKEQSARLSEENRELKAAALENKQEPKLKWGCYQFEGEQGLYCTACYDTKGRKVVTSRMNSNYRSCPVCKAVFGS